MTLHNMNLPFITVVLKKHVLDKIVSLLKFWCSEYLKNIMVLKDISSGSLVGRER